MNTKNEFLKQTVMITVRNRPNVLIRIISFFERRDFIIESINSTKSVDEKYIKYTFTFSGNKSFTSRLERQLFKIVETVEVSSDFENGIEREVALIKVSNKGTDILDVIRLFGGRIIDTDSDSCYVEIVGSQSMVDSFLKAVGSNEVLDCSRTGLAAMRKGDYKNTINYGGLK